MKKLLKLLCVLCLGAALGCSSPDDRKDDKTLRLDVLKTGYTKIANIKITEGAELRTLTANDIMYFTLFMNHLENLTILPDDKAPADPVKLHILTRSTEDDLYIKVPYLYVNGIWFEVAEAELENLVRMEDIAVNGTGS
ncbi:MAG: hypothetical protein K6A40_04120 [Solobacterium sp.]|nr:hypothetical protein [Solobacterium sp.]